MQNFKAFLYSSVIKNWKTTTSGVIALAAVFITQNPEYFPDKRVHLVAEIVIYLGGGGVAVYFGIKYGTSALERLYNDMKEQHRGQLEESRKREDKYLKYLEQKNATDLKVSQTLESICTRLSNVECHMKKEE
jgi:hypothetical protein